MERTLCLLKPDAVQRGLVGKIIGRLEDKGLKIVGTKMKVKLNKNNHLKQKEKSQGNVKSESNPKDKKVFNKIVDLFDGEILH